MPRYVIDESRLVANLETLRGVSGRTGAKILLAQKAFSCTATYPLVSRYLAGTTASSLFEALHAKRHFPGEVHVFNPAYSPDEIGEILDTVDHIVFNSLRQVALYGEAARGKGVSVGLRVNPGVSVATTPAYDACRPNSRFGVAREALADGLPDVVRGLHFHALCEQGLDELRTVLAGFESRFGEFGDRLDWVNFGGGHHITRPGYDVDGLCALLTDFMRRHPGVTVYLEPGEAIALNAGTLESRVLELQPTGSDGVTNAILDVSAACHMPDVLEMPYVPPILGAEKGAAGPFAYRFGGPTCLAGDEIGVYSFPRPLKEGDPVVFGDMAIYTMVKNNTFNGINLPEIWLRQADGNERLVRRFGYDDFASRL